MALLLPACVVAADAEVPWLELAFDRLEYEGMRIEQARLTLDPLDGQQYRVAFQAKTLRFAGDQSLSGLDIECRATLAERLLRCRDGMLEGRHPQFGGLKGQLTFDYHLDRGLQQARLEEVPLAGGRLALDLEGPAPAWRLQAALEGVAIESAQPLLAATGADAPAQALQGRISGKLVARGWPPAAIRAEWTLADVNYTGASVAQSVSGRATLQAEYDDNAWQGEAALAIEAGELYLVPPLAATETPPGFYIAVHERPLTLRTAFRYRPDAGEWTLSGLAYDHPGVLSLRAAGRLRHADAWTVEALELALPATDLAAAFPIYGQPWLIDTPYNDIRVTGTLAAEIAMRDGELGALALELVNADITDGTGRFSVIGLESDLRLASGETHRSRIRWAGMDIYRIALADGRIDLASRGFDVQVTDWQDVTLLDGRLRIDRFDLKSPGEEDFAVHMAGAVEDVSLPILTQALGWPEFGGTLTGEFGGLTYQHGDLRLDGALDMRMFGGRVTLRNLRVRDLFGSLPILTADVDVQQIDLLQLTDRFAFGKITGKLSGYIHDLRLENWQPVAFDARLDTLNDGDTRHRISQRALNNLTQIGGGFGGALSRGFLRYFDEYSYGELGASCRLERGLCHLGGVAQDEQGHYLLTRGGLLPPWVEVRLAGTVVSWEVLIEGFRRIAAGDVRVE